MFSHEFDPELVGAVDAAFVDLIDDRQMIDAVVSEQLVPKGGIWIHNLPLKTFLELDFVPLGDSSRSGTFYFETEGNVLPRMVYSSPYFDGNRHVAVGSWMPQVIDQFTVIPLAKLGFIRPGSNMFISETLPLDLETEYLKGIITAMRANGREIFGPDNIDVKRRVADESGLEETSHKGRGRRLARLFIESFSMPYGLTRFTSPSANNTRR